MGILIPSFRDFSSYREILGVPDNRPKSKHRSLALVSELLKLDELNTSGWTKLSESEKFSQFIPGIVLHSYGGMCPFQIDGVWENYEFYYRERNGYASLNLASIGTFPGNDKSIWESMIKVDESSAEGSFEIFLELWGKLGASPLNYDFTLASGAILLGSGFTMEEAYESLQRFSSYHDIDTANPEGVLLNPERLNTELVNPSSAIKR